MPRLPGRALQVTGTWAPRLRGLQRWYDGSGPGRTLAVCLDCGEKCDEDFGDHGGQCVDYLHTAPRNSALGIVRAFALTHSRFSANDIRTEWDARAISGTSRGPAMGAAQRKKWVVLDGSIRSTDPGTKGHPVNVYRSLIYKPEDSRGVQAMW